MVLRNVRDFGKIQDVLDVSHLQSTQKKSYEHFLQRDVPPDKRKKVGLEAQFREIFPIQNYDKSMHLEYLYYELGEPRYNLTECRQLRLTYGYPLKVHCRLRSKDNQDLAEQPIYIGEMPAMIGGGEFIINGAERVIVSQLHRSPGVDFLIESKEGDMVLHGGRIIPERGSWIEIGVTRKDVLVVRIDQSSKIPATIFLRAMGPEYGNTDEILRLFYQTKTVSATKLSPTMWAVGPIVDTKTGEVIVKAGALVGDRVSLIQQSKIKKVEVIEDVEDALILNTLADDDCQSHEQALLKLYVRLRPGNPPNKEKAKTFFREKFFDENRYRLGKVGRFRLNRKFKQNVDEREMTLRPEDFLSTMKYIIALRTGEGMIDDIDHLGNRRLRTIEELASDEIRKGLLKLRKTVEERMSVRKDSEQKPRIADLVNSKSVSSSINYFFGRGELSQVVDQTNALSQLAHERRLSALGPGGLNRRRAGFEVRDVHISHYGRVCPIETPEGTNIGLISSLAVFAAVDKYGFLLTPYRQVKNGQVTKQVEFLRADEEMSAVLAPPTVIDQQTGKLYKGMILARKGGELAQVDSSQVDYVDISPKQIVGVSASLIPFLEHDDANRALMGSNMQRQAVPLLKTEATLVGTGMEKVVAQNSSMMIRAQRAGVVTDVDSQHIVINHSDEYELDKFRGLNERTCLNQTPTVNLGDKVKAGQIITCGGGVDHDELALGKNVLVGFVSYEGFNFEDAIVISEKLVKNDSFTSIHIDEFTAEVRETRLGTEEFTCDIPNVGEKALRNLDEHGVIREGTRVCPGDILVGKVVPKSKTELTPEEKLLHAIFGRAGEDVKNDSLELPSGYEGVVIKTERFTRRGAGDEAQKKAVKEEQKQYEKQMRAKECFIFRQMIEEIDKKFDPDSQKQQGKSARRLTIVDPTTRQKEGQSSDDEVIYEQIENFNINWVKPASARQQVGKVMEKFLLKIEKIQKEKQRRIERLRHGDELPSGVLEMVKVYIATKRTLSVGDKISGRHGNKGVIAKILPEEDMPFLEDGTSLEILLNPLGVPSRMNVGQILETHLGWVAKVLGFQAVTPVFDGATEDEIQKLTAEANELMRLNNPYPPSNIELNGIEFQRVCTILPQQVEDPGLLYDEKKRDSLRRHKWGKGPFCKFRIPSLMEAGVYVLVVGGHLAYIGECENLSVRFNRGYGSIQPRNCFEGGQETNCRINTSILKANKEGDSIELYFVVRSSECRELDEKNLIEKYSPPWNLEFTERKDPSSYIDGRGIYKGSKQPPKPDEFFVNIPKTLKTQLYDGRTGEPFDQSATIGYIYMMKLHHLVDDKIHARATGPYSLITQQPLGGKTRAGGQRFGEMEVWALEGYGAAYTLQEMLTVKSDDIEGRTKIYESMVKGQNSLEAGTPLSFDVLCNEIRGLALNIQLEKKRLGGTTLIGAPKSRSDLF